MFKVKVQLAALNKLSDSSVERRWEITRLCDKVNKVYFYLLLLTILNISI